MLLELEDVHTFYGTIEAIKGISLTVNEGEIVTLIGANGAGKSTTLRSIQGINRPKRGKIMFKGEDIVGRRPHDIVKLGISQSPEGRRLFSRMSVRENLEMGAFQRVGQGRDRAGHRPRVRALPAAPGAADAEGRHALGRRAADVRDRPGADGQAQAAACSTSRRSGLAPILVERIFDIVREINKTGTAILLVEQNALIALAVANRGYVLETGHVALHDTAAALRRNEQVRKAYLGESLTYDRGAAGHQLRDRPEVVCASRRRR